MSFTERYISSLASGTGNGLSEGTAFTWDQMIADINAGGKGGYRYNVKADGTYTRTGTDQFTGEGTSGSKIIIEGYKTVIGDGYLGRTNQGELNTTNYPYIHYTSTSTINGFYYSGNHVIVTNIYIEEEGRRVAVSGFFNSFINCKVKQNGGQLAFLETTGYTEVINCDIENTKINLNDIACVKCSKMFSSRLTAVSGAAVASNIGEFNEMLHVGNVYKSNGMYGIVDVFRGHILNNTFYNCSSCVKNYNKSIDGNLLCINNIFVDSSIGIENPYRATANHGVTDFNNRYRSNTTANVLGFGNCPQLNAVTSGTTTDFIDAPNGDLRLTKFSPAVGTALNGGDIGAIQSENRMRVLGFKLI